MGLIPDSKAGKVAFFRTRTAAWSASATSIGTTVASVTDLTAKVSDADSKLADQEEAREIYHAAVLSANTSVRAVVDAGSDILKQIRAKAAVAGDDVYALALIPAPAIPSPVGLPGTPTDFKATLDPEGTLQLKWKCANPKGAVGTIYQIARKVGDGAMTQIGVTGPRHFVDSTLPQGANEVTYRIQAVRSTAFGTAALFAVRFGVSASGAAMATVAPRLAA